jgi:putative acetyltransferase
MIMVRPEKPADYAAVYQVVSAAFGQRDEADLVEKLRAVQPQVSLVAEIGGVLVGHIFLSPVTVEAPGQTFVAMGLAPMAVRPESQRQGVGTELIRAGLEECRKLGQMIVFVLGHAGYYPRFGFVTARQHGFSCEYPVPEEHFMVAELQAGALAGRSGLVKYGPAFAEF